MNRRPIRPIKKLIINGTELSKCAWYPTDNIIDGVELDDLLSYAMHLYTNSAYPRYFRRELNERFPDEDIKIEIEYNKHNKYKVEFKQSPRAFLTDSELREYKISNIL